MSCIGWTRKKKWNAYTGVADLLKFVVVFTCQMTRLDKHWSLGGVGLRVAVWDCNWAVLSWKNSCLDVFHWVAGLQKICGSDVVIFVSFRPKGGKWGNCDVLQKLTVQPSYVQSLKRGWGFFVTALPDVGTSRRSSDEQCNPLCFFIDNNVPRTSTFLSRRRQHIVNTE